MGGIAAGCGEEPEGGGVGGEDGCSEAGVDCCCSVDMGVVLRCISISSASIPSAGGVLVW